MNDALIAVFAAAVGGLLTLAGDVVRQRLSSGDRWLEELHRSASEVVGSYGRMRNALIQARLGRRDLPSRAELEYGERSLLVARLMSLPQSERLVGVLDRLSDRTWNLLQATEQEHTQDDWQQTADEQQRAIRDFESVVRELLS